MVAAHFDATRRFDALPSVGQFHRVIGSPLAGFSARVSDRLLPTGFHECAFVGGR